MNCHPKIQFLLLFMLFAWTGPGIFAQTTNRPFVKSFEVGYPNSSYLTSIWHNDKGWFGLFTKNDTNQFGSSYYGVEVALFDQNFNSISNISYGDSSKFYFDYPFALKKSVPDGFGNFWYWVSGYTQSDSLRHQFYGKIDSLGHILFEKKILPNSEYDYFYEFLPLADGTGVFSQNHHNGRELITVLSWVDSLGVIIRQDSTLPENTLAHHATLYLTFDSTENTILAPSVDFQTNGSTVFNVRPKISRFQASGSLIDVVSLDQNLHDHSFGNFRKANGSGYVGWVMKYIQDSTQGIEDHQPGIVLLDSSLNFVSKQLLFEPKIENIPTLLESSADSGFYLVGRHDASLTDSTELNEWFITKFSANLDLLWTRFYNIGGDSINYITQTPVQVQNVDNGSILILVINTGWNITNTTLYRLDSNGCLISGCNIGDTIPTPPIPPPGKPTVDQPMPLLNGQLLAYPNPSNGVWNLEWDVWPGDLSLLKVMDAQGRCLLNSSIQREARPSRLDLQDWPAGVYFLEITSEKGRVFRTKVLLMR